MYEVVKAVVLKAYELVPEAYRQKFRSTTKRENQTYVKFAREKETLFNRWCSSKETDNNFEKLRQLLLIEKFKKCLPDEVKTYLDEKKVETLGQAAVLADDYILTHKSIGSHKLQLPFHLNWQAGPFHPNPHLGDRKGNTPENSYFRPRPNQSLPKGPKCYHCHKRGHIIADCRYLKGANQESTKPTMMTVKAHASIAQGVPPTNLAISTVPQEYKPFFSCGYIEKPVMILRDTAWC